MNNDLKISALTEQIEAEACYSMFKGLSEESKKVCRTDFRKIGNGVAVRTDIYNGFTFNKISGVGFDKIIDKELFNEILNFYDKSNNTFAFQLSPFIIDDGLKKLLDKNGFTVKNNWIRFYRELSDNKLPQPHIKVAEVNQDYAQEFSDIVIGVFGFIKETSAFVHSIFRQKNWKNFMAFDNEKPVAAASLYTDGKTAWCGMAATLPEFRNKGAQSALITKRIQAAKELGCELITSETAESSASFRNMQRLGFKMLYKRPNYVRQTLLK